MKDEPIKLEWIQNGSRYCKEIRRKDFFDVINSLKKGFDDDNRISSELVEIIPDMISIQINKDRNQQIDVPIICCKTPNEERIIQIIRHHKIIWAILNKYCME